MVLWLALLGPVSLAHGLQPDSQQLLSAPALSLPTTPENAAVGSCPVRGALQWVNLKSVVDGDTVRLADGRKVRLIAINTPELGRNGRADQALAREARRAVQAFFADDSRVGLLLGVEPRDRYGRVLAHLYRRDGASLSAYLLARGLGMQVVVPPNDQHWHCLAKVEARARGAGLGVWGLAAYGIKTASAVTPMDAGFQRVQGRVSAVSRVKNGWWLEMGKLSVRLSDRDRAHFGDVDPAQWLHQTLVIRGWLIDRSDSKAVIRNDFNVMMVNLRHPAMMK